MDTTARKYLTGLIGDGIGGSRSPAIHEREADAQGVRLVYSLYDLEALGRSRDDLPAMLDSAKRMGFAGFNVTHPYKQAVIPFLDALDPAAKRIGAVNTVAFRDGVATGFNTDSRGFGESLARFLPGAPLGTVVQLGTGGAGSATAHALAGSGVGRLILHDRERARAEALARSLRASANGCRVEVADDVLAAIAAADGLVNATPIGMDAHPGMPVPAEALRPDLWVGDIIYFPLETELLARARAIGCRTLDGTGMVVLQAAAAFDLFTGLRADRERMLRSFRASLEEPPGC